MTFERLELRPVAKEVRLADGQLGGEPVERDAAIAAGGEQLVERVVRRQPELGDGARDRTFEVGPASSRELQADPLARQEAKAFVGDFAQNVGRATRAATRRRGSASRRASTLGLHAAAMPAISRCRSSNSTSGRDSSVGRAMAETACDEPASASGGAMLSGDSVNTSRTASASKPI